MNELDTERLAWVLSTLGADTLMSVVGLRDGGAPWLIEGRRASEDRAIRAVLRIADSRLGMGCPPTSRESAGMTVAARGGIPVPQVLGEQVDADEAALLIDYLPGSSAQPVTPNPTRLRTLGAIAAAIFCLTPDSVPEALLPAVEHPIPSVDFGALRAEAEPQQLFIEAERRLAEVSVDDPIGFVHGDLWSGNTLWSGEELEAVLDWDCCGHGAAGVDLGSLRCDAAMCYGLPAADHVLDGWESAAARPADSVAYWDVVAALSTPPDISWFGPAITGMTQRADLTTSILRERRDAFLADGLQRLN
ncbi:phosphotransferase enzyme family protein [Humibacter sp.]|uniref:phosphotransferase enzyme family protein n=1 Tax=Humibacter sp. TaxID=1940291 RepID=UPI003F7D19F7